MRRPFGLYESSSALPPLVYHTASPKTISERTSYYQIRLAFHSLPQFIRGCCTTHRFGPPFRFRGTSTWPRQAHLASGLSRAVVFALLRLGFPTPSRYARLDKQHKISRWLILQ